MKRASGVLMPIFSFPSRYGQGCLSVEAHRFLDKLSRADQSIWQVLPVHPPARGNSPYTPESCFAGDPHMIDPGTLARKGLLTAAELDTAADTYLWLRHTPAGHIDYRASAAVRDSLLRRAYSRFLSRDRKDAFNEFCAANGDWLDDAALFHAIAAEQNSIDWLGWPDPLKYRDPAALLEKKRAMAREIDFYRWCQYEFSREWEDLHENARRHGITILGDLPIYAALESADCWAHPEVFQLGPDRRPSRISGCPPDSFAPDGQLWGNPLYDWDGAYPEVLKWWQNRITRTFSLFDAIRLDHFRGFESYFAIPADTRRPADGTWVKGPGIRFFNDLSLDPDADILAEDLGYLTEDVYELLRETGFTGMKVLQFAFDSGFENVYLPHRYGQNCVVYTGTHDNDTTRGWFSKLPDPDRSFAVRYISHYFRTHPYASDAAHASALPFEAPAPGTGAGAEESFPAGAEEGVPVSRYAAGNIDDDTISDAMIRLAAISAAKLMILPLQDILNLGSDARLNTPGVADGNWEWQFSPGAFDTDTIRTLRDITELSRRAPENS